MTGENAALLPILTSDDDGSPIYLCSVCKARHGCFEIARFCADADFASFLEGPVNNELHAASAT